MRIAAWRMLALGLATLGSVLEGSGCSLFFTALLGAEKRDVYELHEHDASRREADS